MNKILSRDQLRELSVPERMELLDDVWASLIEQPDRVPVPEWHRQILDERIAAHERDPDAARPWDDVKSEIMSNLRK
jgi:putative addiction module component (TIGR02574 family)